MMEEQFKSTLDRESFYKKLHNKSGSIHTPINAQTALNTFDLFANWKYGKDQTVETITEKLKSFIKKDGNYEKALICLDEFVSFMQDDHPDVMVRGCNKKSMARPFKALMPASVRSYFAYVRRYMRLRGLKIDQEDINDFISLPTIVQNDLLLEPFEHEEIRQLVIKASKKRRLLYMTLKDSALRLGETVVLKRKDFDVNKEPMEITISGQFTKKKQARLSCVTRETSRDLRRLLDPLKDDDLVFGTSTNLKKALDNEEHYFSDLRLELGKENPKFLEKYDHNGRYKKNIHSLRAFTFTQAEKVHGESFAHSLLGHKKYLGQYSRTKKEEFIEKYKKLEPHLLIFETVKIQEIGEKEVLNLKAEMDTLRKLFLEASSSFRPQIKSS